MLPDRNALPFRIPRSAARVRLFCLPFAGGAAAVYRSWPRLFAPFVEVCPVELPGRGVRFGEPLSRSVVEMRDAVLAAIAPLQDLPIALYGHSMGARIAFEVSQALGDSVIHLFASASPAPDISSKRKLAALSDAELKRELLDIGGTPPEILANDELMGLMLPILRADFAAVDAYGASPGARAPCAVTALIGTEDEVGLADAAAWARFAGGAFRLVELSAGHFFLDAHRERVIREVTADLACFATR